MSTADVTNDPISIERPHRVAMSTNNDQFAWFECRNCSNENEPMRWKVNLESVLRGRFVTSTEQLSCPTCGSTKLQQVAAP